MFLKSHLLIHSRNHKSYFLLRKYHLWEYIPKSNFKKFIEPRDDLMSSKLEIVKLYNMIKCLKAIKITEIRMYVCIKYWCIKSVYEIPVYEKSKSMSREREETCIISQYFKGKAFFIFLCKASYLTVPRIFKKKALTKIFIKVNAVRFKIIY